jgi:host factor-I protein
MSDGKQAPQNIQDAFLNTVRREKTIVIVYLLNGAKLTGRIRSFDKFSVLLESGSQEQLIFKHAISTISQVRRATGELQTQSGAESHPRDASNELASSPDV